jgi:putative transcriptional regulator
VREIYLGGDLQFLQEAVSDHDGPSILLCFGYIGWGPAQLERELLSGAWITHTGSAKYIFDTAVDKIVANDT